MTKKLLFLTGITIWGAIIYLAYINKAITLSLSYIKGNAELSLPIFVLLLGIFATLATILIMQSNISDLEQKVRQQSRKSEKASIVKEEAQDKIKLLEGKIQTLEKALSEALKKD